MPQRTPQHLRSNFRFVTSSTSKGLRQAPKNSSLQANKRWFASVEKAAVTRSDSKNAQKFVAYATAGATLGAITCYRSDSMIAHDPYNLGGTVAALLAFNATNAASPISWPLLAGSLVVGEFLGNGFRHVHGQYAVTKEDRRGLLQDVSEFAQANEKDLLDVFENTMEAVMLQAKTRWNHLAGFYEEVPDHMTQHELKIAIHRWASKAGEEDPQGAAEQKEALLQVLSVADINNDGVITFMEFSRALLLLELAKRKVSSAKSELYFRAIDLNNSGTISEDELLHFARRLHALGGIPHKDRTTPHWSGLYERPSTPEEICSKWMKRFDLNKDGVISRSEFTKMAREIDFGPSFLFTKYFERSRE